MPSVVTSIVGGIQGASAAHHAADAIKQGNNQAIGTMNDAVSKSNTAVTQTAKDAGGAMKATAAEQGGNVVAGAQTNAQKLTDAAKAGSDLVTGTAKTAGDGAIAAGDKAAAGLDQFAATGRDASKTLDGYLAEGGKLNSSPTANDIMSNDPGYQFRLQQGQQAVMRAQAAMGGAGGGGASKAMMRYNQGTASDEYGKAFDRYRATNNDLYDHLSGTAAQGQQAATTQGNFGTDAAKFAGNLETSAATTGADLTTRAASQNSSDLNGANVFAGNANINAGVFAGNADLHAGDVVNNNTMTGGRYVGDMQSGNGHAEAAGDMGAASAWSQMLNGVGAGANSAILGGLAGGGGGFNLGGALTGNPNFGMGGTPGSGAMGIPASWTTLPAYRPGAQS